MESMKIHYIDYANDKQELFEFKNIDVSTGFINNAWIIY
jgi:hypothetical protein